jgi:plasmid stability protein
MKTTIDLPDEVFRKVKVRAAEEGRTMRDLIVEALTESLKKNSAVEKAPRKTYEEYLHEWETLAQRVSEDMPPGKSALEDLKKSRDRY